MKKLTIERFPTLTYACEEALNTLCTNLTFSGENVKKIMVTSCQAAEGKSFVSMNIMRTMAKLGKKVAFVDADLRRSTITSKYKVKGERAEREIGLSQMLAGMVGIDDVIYETNIEGALMVPSGRLLSNPLPLLNSPRFPELLDELSRRVDYVIVDADPIGTVIDAAQIGKFCDGTLLVVNYNKVRRHELVEIQKQLAQTNCPILGTVLNQVDFDRYLSRKYYSKYYNYYRSDEGDGRDERGKSTRKRMQVGRT